MIFIDLLEVFGEFGCNLLVSSFLEFPLLYLFLEFGEFLIIVVDDGALPAEVKGISDEFMNHN